VWRPEKQLVDINKSFSDRFLGNYLLGARF